MSYARRTDANHADIRAALERLGWTVKDMSAAGRGFPDFIAHRAGVLRLIEVKAKRGTLTQAQRDFQALGFPVSIIRTVEDCVRLR